MSEDNAKEDRRPARNYMQAFFNTVGDILEAPVIFVRESIVKPNQKSYPWYHQKFRRVPTIDECYTDDVVCYEEADQQYKRDKKVDESILKILRQRFEDCTLYEAPDHLEKCHDLMVIYQEAETNYFIKYGDLGAYTNVKAAYMKQKHRMIWERRHGPVGSRAPKKAEEA